MCDYTEIKSEEDFLKAFVEQYSWCTYFYYKETEHNIKNKDYTLLAHRIYRDFAIQYKNVKLFIVYRAFKMNSAYQLTSIFVAYNMHRDRKWCHLNFRLESLQTVINVDNKTLLVDNHIYYFDKKDVLEMVEI